MLLIPANLSRLQLFPFVLRRLKPEFLFSDRSLQLVPRLSPHADTGHLAPPRDQRLCQHRQQTLRQIFGGATRSLMNSATALRPPMRAEDLFPELYSRSI